MTLGEHICIKKLYINGGEILIKVGDVVELTKEENNTNSICKHRILVSATRKAKQSFSTKGLPDKDIGFLGVFCEERVDISRYFRNISEHRDIIIKEVLNG